jgi:hypothetical protein
MYDLQSPLEWIGIFFSRHLMSVHVPAKFQQYSVILAKSAADTKKHMFFRDGALFMADTVTMPYHCLDELCPRPIRSTLEKGGITKQIQSKVEFIYIICPTIILFFNKLSVN